MFELLNNPVFLVFSSLTLVGVVGILAGAWKRVRQLEIEAGLKQDMLQRGLSADDIKKVVEATGEPIDFRARKARALGLAFGCGREREEPRGPQEGRR
jgi:hypothetical protein